MDSESLLMSFVATDGISRVVNNIGKVLEDFRAKLPEIGAALDKLFAGGNAASGAAGIAAGAAALTQAASALTPAAQALQAVAADGALAGEMLDIAAGKFDTAAAALIAGGEFVAMAEKDVATAAGKLAVAAAIEETTATGLERAAQANIKASAAVDAAAAEYAAAAAAEAAFAKELEMVSAQVNISAETLAAALGKMQVLAAAETEAALALQNAAREKVAAAAALDAAAAAEIPAAAELTVSAGLFSTAAGMLSAVLGPLVIGLVAATAALVGLVAGLAVLQKLATATSDYSLQVERNSVLLNRNTDLYQTVVQGLGALGTSQQQVNVQLTRFNRSLEVGAPALKAMHTSLKDLGLAGLPADEAFIKLTDDLSKMTNQSEKFAIVQALFSQRTGPQFTEFLSTMGGQYNSTTTNLQELTAELTKMGLVMNQGQLAVGGLAAIAHQRLSLELKGLEMQVGARLETAFMLLWNVMSQVLGGGAALIQTLSDVLAKAVIWVAAFVSAMFGLKLSMDMFTVSATPVIDKIGLFQQGQDEAAQASANLTSALQDQIQTLNDQKSALSDAQAAQDEIYGNQIQALQDQKAAQDQVYSDTIENLKTQKTTQDDAINSQIAAVDEAKKALELQQRQHDMNLTLLQDQANLAMTQNELAAAKFLNNGSVSIGGLLARQADEERKLAQDTQKVHYDGEINKLDATKVALEAQKKAQDDVFDDKIKLVEAEKKAVDGALADKIKDLEEEKKAYDRTVKDEMRLLNDQTKDLQQQLREQTRASKEANTIQLGDANTIANAVTQLQDASAANAAKNYASMAGSGTSAFDQIKAAVITVKDAILDIQIDVLYLKGAFAELGGIVSVFVDIAKAASDVGSIMADLGNVLLEIAKGPLGNVDGAMKTLTGHTKDLGDVLTHLGNTNPTASIEAQIAFLQAQKGGAGGSDAYTHSGKGGGFTYGLGGIISEPVLGVGLNTGMRYRIGESGDEMIVPMNNQSFVAGPGAPQPMTGGSTGSGEKTRDVLMDILDILTAIANDKPAPGGYAASMRAG